MIYLFKISCGYLGVLTFTPENVTVKKDLYLEQWEAAQIFGGGN